MTENTLINAKLPDSFYFISKADIHPGEIIALRESVNWRGDTAERWQQCIDQSLTIIGVRDAESNLVGMACIAGNVRHAVLCDLVVHPHCQHQGIGGAIMSELLRSASELHISYLYAELAKTNPFRNQMIDFGFEMTGDSLFKEVHSS